MVYVLIIDSKVIAKSETAQPLIEALDAYAHGDEFHFACIMLELGA